MAAGLRAIGVPFQIVNDAGRRGDALPILLGTTCWRALESGDYLLVDRCSFGDTNHWVTLVRNGHGRRGDHRVPEGAPAERWERIARTHGIEVAPWRNGRRRVLCGQTETYSPTLRRLEDWYGAVRSHVTHFRRHPAGENPTGLPECRNWADVGQAITLNSSVAVDAVLAGIPTVTMDAGAMAWDVTSHTPEETAKPARLPWLHWLAWTQWTHDEIAEGIPWAHLL
jgi:hypothetical protein